LADFNLTQKQWYRRRKELGVSPSEVDEYIDDCIEKSIEPTISGLLKKYSNSPLGLHAVLETGGYEIRIARNRCYELGMPRFGPHALRRRMACYLMENGASVRQAQLAGRWVDPEMVLRYSAAVELESVRPRLPFGG
jgi:integrase